MCPIRLFAIIPDLYRIFLDMTLALDFNDIFAGYEDPSLIGVVFQIEYYFLVVN